MKFWQKIFLSTFFLFLFVCNLCVYLVTENVYRYQLKQERLRAALEEEAAAGTLSEDLTGLMSRGELSGDTLRSLMESYNTRYEKRGVQLFLYRGGAPAVADRQPPELFVKNREGIGLKEEAAGNYIVVAGPLKGRVENYSLLYLYSLEGMNRQWKALDGKIRLIGAGGSAGLLLLLLFVLRSLTRPLEALTAAARGIAGGNYADILSVKGKDEVAELSREWNHMTEEIRRRIRQSEEENRNKQRFIDNMSHEMRTPLATVRGYAELMQRASLSEEERQEALEEILQESGRLLRMREALLSLSLLREQEAPKEKTAVREVLGQVRKEFDIQLEKYRICWIQDICAETVTVNRILLEILVSNLIQNAVWALLPAEEALSGKRRKEIRVSCVEEDGRVILQVCDNGRGMTEEELRHITEPFYRADRARSRKAGGTGLGLALCRQIAVNQNAVLAFASKPGEGTRATVSFTSS